MDIYASFYELIENEDEHAFEISLHDQQSAVTIIAPHGGGIEPGTTELAKLIAGNKFNFYSFIAKKTPNSGDLHITSHRFDEPSCVDLVSRSHVVISLHGFYSKEPMIYMGGLDCILKSKIHRSLQDLALPVADHHPKYGGVHPNNICNRSRTGQGVQLEISRHLRACASARALIARAVTMTLALHLKKPHLFGNN